MAHPQVWCGTENWAPAASALVFHNRAHLLVQVFALNSGSGKGSMMHLSLTNQEWALEWLAGVALGKERGTVTQKQLEGARRRVLLWGVNVTTVDLTIATKKAPPRGGVI